MPHPFNIFKSSKDRESKPQEKEPAQKSVTPIRAIVGLGNPGDSYQNTRHNIGFLFLDYLAEKEGKTWRKEKRFSAEIITGNFFGQKILLGKPQTYMNESGQSLSQLVRYHRWSWPSVVVVYDEINLSLGEMKLSDRGSAGGHNGMGSILGAGGADVTRFRLGIGHKRHTDMDLKDHVLGRFSPQDLLSLQSQMGKWADALQLVIDKGATIAMAFINQKDSQLNE